MIRQILCRKCGDLSQKSNRVWLGADHKIYPTRCFRWLTLFQPCICDACGVDVDGIAGALTLLKEGEEQPWDWAAEFGSTLPEEAVKLFDKLTL